MLPERVARITFRVALATALTVVTWLALARDPPLHAPIFSLDKLNHAAAFLVLALLAEGAFPWSARQSRYAGLLAYGLTLEILQWQGGYRVFEWMDVGADAAGIAIYEAASPWPSRLLARLSSSQTGQ